MLPSEFVSHVADYTSVEEVYDALCHRCVFLRVGNHDDGCAFGIEFAEQVHHFLAVLGVEVSGRLVGQYQFWI